MITMPAVFGLSKTVFAQPLAEGRDFALAVCNINTAWAWEYNAIGQLGNGANTNSQVPLQVVALCPVLSINEIAEQVSVSVFPNPSNGQFTLALSNEKGFVEIYNSIGKLVYQSEIRNPKSEMDLSNQPKGMYFVRFYAGLKMQTEKIIIQ